MWRLFCLLAFCIFEDLRQFWQNISATLFWRSVNFIRHFKAWMTIVYWFCLLKCAYLLVLSLMTLNWIYISFWFIGFEDLTIESGKLWLAYFISNHCCGIPPRTTRGSLRPTSGKCAIDWEKWVTARVWTYHWGDEWRSDLLSHQVLPVDWREEGVVLEFKLEGGRHFQISRLIEKF